MGFLKKLDRSLFGRKAKPYGTYDSRGVNQIQWDPNTGMPIGLTGAVDPNNALAYQQRANEIVAQRNQRRRSDASAFLEQGLRASETFRPGGFAAMASGLYGQRAQLAFQDQIDAPDLMAGYREQTRVDSANAQRRAGKMKFIGGMVNSAATMIGSIAGGPIGGAAANQASAHWNTLGEGESTGGVGFDPYAIAGAGQARYSSTSFDDGWSEYTNNRMNSMFGN